MASLSALHHQLHQQEAEKSRWEAKKKKAEENRDKAKNRKKALEPLIRDLQGDFDGNCRDINRQANNMVESAYQGIKGVVTASNLDTVISGNLEKNPETDAILSSALSDMNQELVNLIGYYEERVQEIEECKRNISRLNSAIRATKQAIRDEERRQREEEIRRRLAEIF